MTNSIVKDMRPTYKTKSNYGGVIDSGSRSPFPVLPSSIPGLIIRLDANLGTYQDTSFLTPANLDGQLVGGWLDQSGNSNNMTAPASGAKIRTNLRNGLSGIQFDGNSFFQAVGTNAQPYTFFIVQNYISLRNSSNYILGNGTNPEVSLGSVGGVYTMTSSSILSGTLVTNTNPHILVAASIIVQIVLCLLIVFRILAENTGATGLTNPRLSDATLATANKRAIQNVFEFLLYNTAVAASDVTTITNYLSAKWGAWGLMSFASNYGAIVVNPTSTLVLASNPERKGGLISNNSAQNIYLGMDKNVTISNGFPILPNGVFATNDFGGAWKGAVYGVCSGGTSDVRYWEFGA